MIGMIVGGIGELVVDLFVQDEAEKRAAKAAAWAAAGVVGVVDGGASTAGALAAGAAGVMMATQGVAASVDDAKGKSVVDTAGAVVAGGMTSWVALTKTAVGAGVGAGVGGAVDGEDGAVMGMSLGATLMRGSSVENLAKLGGGTVGGAVGALAAEDERARAQAFELGMSVGMAVGGGVAGAMSTEAMAVENAELEGGAPAEDAVERARAQAVAALVAEAAAPLVAAAAQEDGDFLDTWSVMRGAAGAAASAAQAGYAGFESGRLLEAAYHVTKGLAASAADVALHLAARQERADAGEREREDRKTVRAMVEEGLKLAEEVYQRRARPD